MNRNTVRVTDKGVREKAVGRQHCVASFALGVFTRAGRQANSVLWGLFSDDERELVSAVANASKCRAKHAVPILHGLLFHEKPIVRIFAVKSLASIGEPTSVFFLMRALLADADVLVKREIASIVGDFAKRAGSKESGLRAQSTIPEKLQASLGVEGEATITYEQFLMARLMGRAKDTKEDKFVRVYALDSILKIATRVKPAEASESVEKTDFEKNKAGIACDVAKSIAFAVGDDVEVRMKAVEVLAKLKDDAVSTLADRLNGELPEGERRVCEFAHDFVSGQRS